MLTALRTHPNLVKYFICVPYNLPDARNKKQRSGKQQSGRDTFNSHKRKWEKIASDSGMNVEFIWWGDSELTDMLTQSGKEGMRAYWFSGIELTSARFNVWLEQAKRAAGPRYSPDVNVNLPLMDKFNVISRCDAALDSLRKEVASWTYATMLYAFEGDTKSELYKDARSLQDMARDIHNKVLTLDIQKIGIVNLDSVSTSVSDAIIFAANVESRARQLMKNEETNSRSKLHRFVSALTNVIYQLEALNDNINDIENLANSSIILLKGNAGVGKTHLLCDFTGQSLSEGIHTILLMGQLYRSLDNPWKQTLEQLELPTNFTPSDFISSLESLALSSGKQVVIIIDALNEGAGRDLWKTELSRFLSQFKESPYISVILSVRTDYVYDVIPDDELDSFYSITHTGFSECAYDAVNLFCEYYKLKTPSFPILSPEFYNPLFLRLLCDSLKDKGDVRLERGSHSIMSIFYSYLDSVNKDLAKRLDYDPSDNKVRKAVTQFANLLIESNERYALLSKDDVQHYIDKLLPGKTYSESLYKNLCYVNILIESSFTGENGSVYVYFAYERLLDYIVADQLFTFYNKIGDVDVIVSKIGLTSDEAVYVLSAERLGLEFVDIAMVNDVEAFINSLLWRGYDAFSEHTLELTETLLLEPGVRSNDTLIDALVSISIIPSHPLNAIYLHDILLGVSMSDRDYLLQEYFYTAYVWDDASTLHRLLSWSSNVNSNTDYQTVRLACVILTWFLSASNRFVRDISTKALIHLLETRLDILLDLINDFRDVDDIYIVERLYAVAYAVSMRSSDIKGIEKLAQLVYDNVFASASPVPHILLRDYARGTIERSIFLDNELDGDVGLILPPYNSIMPDIPDQNAIDVIIRTMDELDPKRGGGWHQLNRSLMGYLGDFNIYTVRYHCNSWNIDKESLIHYILNRVMELGWTIDKFDSTDSAINHNNYSRSGHKPERVGKKYQWIALHEILAYVSDNYEFKRNSGYNGPWQDLLLRDMDLSCTYSIISEEGSQINTWWAPIKYDNWQLDIPGNEWSADTSDLPNMQDQLVLIDSDGHRWINLRSYAEARYILDISDSMQRTYRELWHRVVAYAVLKSERKIIKEYVDSGKYWEYSSWMDAWSSNFPGYLA